MTEDGAHADWAAAAVRLAAAADDDRDWYRTLARELVRPADRLLADIGCGGAGMTVAMAAAMACGRIVAVDGEPAVLAEARRHVERWPHPEVDIVLATADLSAGLHQLSDILTGPADLIWASAVVHHLPDQQAAVNGLAALLAPGGRLALAEGGLPGRRLPWDLGIGAPGHEARLHLAEDHLFAAMRAALPKTRAMPYGWTDALRHAGLHPVRTATTLVEQPPPLSSDDRHRVVTELRYRVQRVTDAGLLDGADTAAWARLLDDQDSHFLGHRTDLTRLDARSVHVGVRPAGD